MHNYRFQFSSQPLKKRLYVLYGLKYYMSQEGGYFIHVVGGSKSVFIEAKHKLYKNGERIWHTIIIISP